MRGAVCVPVPAWAFTCLTRLEAGTWTSLVQSGVGGCHGYVLYSASLNSRVLMVDGDSIVMGLAVRATGTGCRHALGGDEDASVQGASLLSLLISANM